MNILILGSGAREHALAWKISQSPKAQKIYGAPGNPGMQTLGECIPMDIQDSVALTHFCKEKEIGLVLVGPEAPLAAGIADELWKAGIRVFGPSKREALLEASKAFAKGFMKRHRIPTARYRIYEASSLARSDLGDFRFPLVLKADGLALGKGVRICLNLQQAQDCIHDIMEKRVFGEAGKRLIMEEYLTGEETTLMAFCDGKTLRPLPLSQDHKRAYDGNLGPNTGGMGAIAPLLHIPPRTLDCVQEQILDRILEGLQEEKMEYRGLLYIGLMLTPQGPKVLEFNVRFGDPETQAVLPLLKTDLLDLLEATVEGRLKSQKIELHQAHSVCIVLASGGYPGAYESGKIISGLENPPPPGTHIFHAGTQRLAPDVSLHPLPLAGEGRVRVDALWTTAGGRVLSIVGTGPTPENAREKAYAAASAIHFEGMHFRKDIGAAWVAQIGPSPILREREVL